MSNYVKSTDFAAKDALASGNAGKIVKGTEIDTEFNNIATSIATKANLASPEFSGTPSAPTPGYPDSSTRLATTAYVASAVTAMSSGLGDPGANGMVVRTASGITTSRSITAGTGISVSNGSGVSANPSIAVSDSGIGTNQIANAAVTGAKIENSAVNTDKIANSSITAAKLDGGQSGSAPIFGARAWVNFDGSGSIGGNMSIRAQGNVSSVSKTASGTYQINFNTALADGNYAILGGAMGGNEAVMLWANSGTNTQTGSAATIQMRDANDPGTLTNPTHIWVAIIR